MVFLKHGNLLQHRHDKAFDTLVPPGAITPYSGVYRCELCGHEIVSSKGAPIPSAAHHQHPSNHEPIRWRLIVRTIQRKKPSFAPSIP